jgi:hypothetical protein
MARNLANGDQDRMDFDKYAALSPDVAQLVESRQQTQASIEQ